MSSHGSPPHSSDALSAIARVPSAISNAANDPRKSILVAITLGGLVAATIDIGVARLINHHSILFILHAVAGGLLAERSFAGGATTALLGASLQELMGLLIAAIFVIAARLLPVLRRRWIAFGLAYGVVIFFVMNYVVVPLSAWHFFPRFSMSTFFENLLAMLLFGLIVAYFARAERIR